MEERRSLSDEEAAGLLYGDAGPYHQAEKSQSRRKDIFKSTLFRTVAAISGLIFLFWLFAPVTPIPDTLKTASSPPKAIASSPSHADEQAASDGKPKDTTADATDACALSKCLTKKFTFENVNDFTLRNLIEPTERGDSFRNSYLRLSPGPDSQKEDIVVKFTFNTTDPSLFNLLDVQRTPKALMAIFPTSQPIAKTDLSQPRDHIETQTEILLRPGLRISQLTVESTVLGINIPAPIDFKTTMANLTCTAGNLYADPMIDASFTLVTMEAGTVAGRFPLFEVLALESDAGTMNIEVIPKAIPKVHNGKHMVPAHLAIQSSAGNVNVQYDTAQGLPERDYTVSVYSDFGRITGNYIHGSYTSLRTSMGDIEANITPFASDRDESELITISHAGKQRIMLKPPFYDQAVRMARIEASHESKLGSIEVTYPKQWEGTVEAVSRMGAVSLEGMDLAVIREQKSLLGKLVEGEKGRGEGSVVCGTEKGDVMFRVAS